MDQFDLQQLIQREKESTAYRAYLETREHVLSMLANEPRSEASSYWQEELRGFEYLLDASPLLVSNLRHHCYHITGIRDYEYRKHHARKVVLFREKLKKLKAVDPHGLSISENPAMGGFGHEIDGALYNIDTLKFYEALIALEKSGALGYLRDTKEKKTIIEIGSGWGGFAYQFKTIFPEHTYILVDFPLSFLFAGTYIKTLFPNARVHFIETINEARAFRDYGAYDFIFVPHYAWDALSGVAPAVAVNLVSFQEMTNAQVNGYVEKSLSWGIPYLYSLNRDVSPHNTELSSVGEILSKYYDTEEITVLDVPYHTLSLPKESLIWRIKNFVKKKLIHPRARSPHEYRHIIGRHR